MPRLTFSIIDAPPVHHEWTQEHVTLGREDDNGIVLEHASISRHHAAFFVRDGKRWVKDLGSTNGIHVHGQKITEHELKDGEPVQLGEVVCLFENAAAEPAPASKAESKGKDEATNPKLPAAAVPPLQQARNPDETAALRKRGRIMLKLALLIVLPAAPGALIHHLKPTRETVPVPPAPVMAMAEVKPDFIVPGDKSAAAPVSQMQEPLVKEKYIPPSAQPPQATPAPPKKTDVIYERLPDEEMTLPVISPDLRHVLHAVRRKTPGLELTDLFLNGKVVRTVKKIAGETAMRFSDDSSSWLTRATDTDGRDVILLPDRTLSIDGALRDTVGSRDFSVVACIVRRAGEDHLCINNETISAYHHIISLRLSADGRHWAYVAVRQLTPVPGQPPAGERVITDRGRGPIYDGIRHLTLSPDGRRLAYAAHRHDEDGVIHELIVDGSVKDSFRGAGGGFSGLVFSDDSKRFACVIQKPGQPPSISIEGLPPKTAPEEILPDAAATTADNLLADDALRIGPVVFSADGRHAAFAINGRRGVVCRDGKDIGPYTSVDLDSLVFSPDGTRLAYVVRQPVGNVQTDVEGVQTQIYATTLHENGRELQTLSTLARRSPVSGTVLLGGYAKPQFSADSNFLVYEARAYSTRHGLAGLGLFINGQALIDMPPPVPSVTAFCWTDASSLRVIAESASPHPCLRQTTLKVVREP